MTVIIPSTFSENNLPFLRQRRLQSSTFLWREHHIQVVLGEVSQLLGKLHIQAVQVCHQKSFKVHWLHGVIELRLGAGRGQGCSHTVWDKSTKKTADACLALPLLPAKWGCVERRCQTQKWWYGKEKKCSVESQVRTRWVIKITPQGRIFLCLIASWWGFLRRSKRKSQGFAAFL